MTRRYPLQPLCEAVKLPPGALAREVGMSGSTLKSALQVGIGADAADRYAIRFWLHPVNVWPDYGPDHPEPIPCGNPQCGQVFTPTRSGNLYCSRGCGQRVYDRRAVAKRRAKVDGEGGQIRVDGPAPLPAVEEAA